MPKAKKTVERLYSLPDPGMAALNYTIDKKEHISHIRGPPGHVERNDSLQHDQEAFLCEICHFLSFLIVTKI